jgi:hypothetical protein
MTVRNFSVDPDTGDLLIQGGQLVLVSGLEAIRQNVRQRLLFFQGEWFLDPTVGLPWFQRILVKIPDVRTLASVFKSEIENTPGVDSVTSLVLDYDKKTRTVSVTYRASTNVGELADTVQS